MMEGGFLFLILLGDGFYRVDRSGRNFVGSGQYFKSGGDEINNINHKMAMG